MHHMRLKVYCISYTCFHKSALHQFDQVIGAATLLGKVLRLDVSFSAVGLLYGAWKSSASKSLTYVNSPAVALDCPKLGEPVLLLPALFAVHN